MDEARKQENQDILKVLEALKKASKDLQTNLFSIKDESETAIKALLQLQAEADTFLSTDPNLFKLSQLLCNLKILVDKLRNSQDYSLTSFLCRQFTYYDISRVATLIETEIQAWIDRVSIQNLVKTLIDESADEDEKVKLLSEFENRVSMGFNRDLQDLILKAKIFSNLESMLCDTTRSKRFRERSAVAIATLVRFNKDVFVGQVLMGPTIRALISMASSGSIQVLSSLIKLIKSPLVDEIESNGEIPKIISFLSSEDLQITVMAVDCILEIGYFGRKEAIDAMLEKGLIKKLVELQRSKLGGDLIEMDQLDENENGNGGVCLETEWEMKMESEERRIMVSHPFASCVARFSVQLEVGEGLRQSEKRAFKLEILRRVREASVSDAESATIIAEVLWGSSP